MFGRNRRGHPVGGRRELELAGEQPKVLSLRPTGASAQVRRTVDEGLLIALAAVRMAVKNRIIVGALRDSLHYDAAVYVRLACDEIELLARQNDTLGARVREQLRNAEARPYEIWPHETEVRRLRMLDAVYSEMAVALRAIVVQDDALPSLVESARRDAWDEVGGTWQSQLHVPSDPQRDALYQRERSGRLQELVYIDLAGLLLGEG